MSIEGITADIDMTGVPKDGYGEPIGELQEPPAMELAGKAFRSFHGRMKAEKTKWDLGRLANNAGITTLTDLGNPSSTDPATIEEWRGVVDHPAFPTRLFIFDMTIISQATIETLIATRKQSSEKLRLGAVKVVLDGSIQGYTARLRWPGYINGEQNGMWLHHPEKLTEWMRPFHEAEFQVHAHCNGDQAVEVFIEAVRELQAEFKRPDHRYVVEHCQLTSARQYEQMAELGMCANLFSNHTWYWGEQHAAYTVGPDRAARMNSARTALDLGVPISIHTDAPVTPLGPLHVAWTAVNRVTPSGETLGPDECISVDEALRAITLGAAHLLKMDHEVGSISPGKFADLAILEEDPYTADPMDLRDIPVWGTMLGGTIFPASSKS
jgi:predicted amidohydrolase YtcJ